MKHIIITLLAVLLPALASAQSWVKAWQQDATTLYVYSDVQKETITYLAWEKRTYDTPEKRKERMAALGVGEPVAEIKVLHEYNNSWTQHRTKTISVFDEKGNCIQTVPSDDEWQYITPESINESVRDTAKNIYENGGK